MNKREAVRRIKSWVADELRGRVALGPPEEETELVQQLWEHVVWDIADRISPESAEGWRSGATSPRRLGEEENSKPTPVQRSRGR